MRLVHAAIVLPPLLAAFPFACAASPRTLGFLPGGDAGAASDATTAPDQAATASGGTPTFGDGGATPSGACETAGGKTAVGCEFFTMEPDPGGAGIAGSCYAAYVSNGGTTDATIALDFGGAAITNFADFARVPSGYGPSITYGPLDGAGKNVVHPGQVAILFLAGRGPDAGVVECPAGITPAVPGDAFQYETGVLKSFHVQTDSPVTAYDMYPYGGGISTVASATLLLPTSTWGTSYVAVDAYAYAGDSASTTDLSSIPWISIIGLQDGTQVTIKPTANIVGGGGLLAAAQGSPQSYSVNRGQVLQFVQHDELVGSAITSTHPVGVFGGQTCMSVTLNDSACDTGHQQIPPVSALGNEYVYARYRDRYAGIPESPPVRIVGVVDGTQLTYEPAAPSGAPQTIGLGQMVEFNASAPFTVSSQDNKHPFYVAAYMQGCSAYEPQSLTCLSMDSLGNCIGDCRGDPEFVNAVPPGQFGKSYVLFTDPTYPETELVVVRQSGSSGFDDVALDCLGGNITGWTAVGTSGKYQYARVDLVTGNFAPQGKCNNGQHTMSSMSPFGVTVWGWGSAASGGSFDLTNGIGIGTYSQFVSYAYPGGTGVAAINPVVLQ